MKNCETCKHQELKHNEVPCVECSALYEKWTDKESKMNCEDCKHISVDEDAEPCKSCLIYPNWEKEVTSPVEEEEIEKTCSNCKFGEVDGLEEPCSYCQGASNWKSENHMRFQDAQVGDKVYSRLYGSGVITRVSSSDSTEYHLTINFEKGHFPKLYTVDGKLDLRNEEATLFYETSDNKYSEIRPEQPLDWSKVPVNTKVNYQSPRYIVRKGHYKSPGFVFADGEASWSEFISGFNHVKCDIIELAEDVILDGKTYPVGTRWTAPK